VAQAAKAGSDTAGNAGADTGGAAEVAQAAKAGSDTAGNAGVVAPAARAVNPRHAICTMIQPGGSVSAAGIGMGVHPSVIRSGSSAPARCACRWARSRVTVMETRACLGGLHREANVSNGHDNHLAGNLTADP
jgi:hypothetical protein